MPNRIAALALRLTNREPTTLNQRCANRFVSGHKLGALVEERAFMWWKSGYVVEERAFMPALQPKKLKGFSPGEKCHQLFSVLSTAQKEAPSLFCDLCTTIPQILLILRRIFGPPFTDLSLSDLCFTQCPLWSGFAFDLV